MKFNIELSWSKIVALLVLGCAFVLDLKNEGNSAFIFALPFVVVLITGKQMIDSKKKEQ